MTLINWRSKPEYVREHLDEIEMSFKKIHISYKEQELKRINDKLTGLIDEYLSAKVGIENIAQLTILSLESQRKLIMGNKTPEQKEDKKTYSKFLTVHDKPVVEFDDVTNNPAKLSEDYDITIDDSNGEVYIASNHDKAGTMIQGRIKGFIKRDQNIPGAEFNYVIDGKLSQPSNAGLRKARFSGTIYFENLPVDVMTTGQQKLSFDKKEEVKPNVQQKQESVGSKETDTSKFEFPSEDALRKIKAGQLQPQKGLSRTERRAWNNVLRVKYPQCFDARGNWTGFPDTTNGNNATPSVDTNTVSRPKDEVKVKETKSVNALGLMGETGVGNAITKMTDEKIKNGFMLARYFEGKGYAIASTPAKEGDFEKSAFIVCNKERTAKFMLAGLERNPSFATRVDGMGVFKISELKAKYFEDDTLYAYWVTNAVTANKALGTQDRDIEEIKSRIGS